MSRMPSTALSALLLLGAAASAQAQGGPLEAARRAWTQLEAEATIERRLAVGQVRGWLGPRPADPDFSPRRAEGGELSRGPGGIPLLHLRGTPEELGRQHGLLLRGEIRALTGYVASFVGERELPEARRRAAELFRAHVPERYLREMRALAEAAGLDEADVFLAQSFTDLYRVFACTCLSAPSAGGTFLARNLDFPGMGYLGRFSLVQVVEPAGQRPFVSVGWPGLVGVLSGQSEALALAVMVVHGDEGARSGVPFQLAFRQALEEADDAAGAEALLRRLPLTVTNNLMLVDRAGTARVLELHPDRIVARAPDRQRRLVSTNHFVSRELREPRLSVSFWSSSRRYRRAAEALPGAGPARLEQAHAALARCATPGLTLQSMVFLPGDRALEVALRDQPPATAGQFVRLEWDQLLASGAAAGGR